MYTLGWVRFDAEEGEFVYDDPEPGEEDD